MTELVIVTDEGPVPHCCGMNRPEKKNALTWRCTTPGRRSPKPREIERALPADRRQSTRLLRR